MAIEDSFLEAGSFKKIATLSETTNTLLLFLRKFDDYYPKLNEKATSVELTKFIIQKIDEVLDKYGEIKDSSSPALVEIRRNMAVVRGKINQSFGMALSSYNSLGYLDDIRETIVDNRRVLAVLAMYRRKVKGSTSGSSKTGSIAYIEPEATLRYSRELSNLEYEEREEITRILKQLHQYHSALYRAFTSVSGFFKRYGCGGRKSALCQQNQRNFAAYQRRKTIVFPGRLPPYFVSEQQSKKQADISADD